MYFNWYLCWICHEGHIISAHMYPQQLHTKHLSEKSISPTGFDRHVVGFALAAWSSAIVSVCEL
jgi:hypothetical protein